MGEVRQNEQGEHKGFQSSETILYTTMVDTCHYTFVKTPKIYHTKNPKANYRL